MMTTNSRLLTAAALASLLTLSLVTAGCSVSAGGQIPCVDDSNCPTAYPVCGTGGKCVEGTVTSGGVTVAIAGVIGKDPAVAMRGAVQVQVSAKSASGISKVELIPGAGTPIAPTAGSAGPLYTFALDTSTLADGALALTAKVTPGDTAQEAVVSPAFNIIVDNTAPAVTAPGGGVPALSQSTASLGTTVFIDVKITEVNGPVTLTATLTKGTTSLPMSEVASGTAEVRRLSYTVGSAGAGAYKAAVTATDAAGNSSKIEDSTATPLVLNITAPLSVSIALAAHKDAGGQPVKINGLPAATVADKVVATLTLPAGVSFATGFPKYSVIKSDTTTATVPTSATDSTGTYTIPPGEPEGIATFKAEVEDAAGNSATVTASFIVQTTAPVVEGGDAGIFFSRSYAGPAAATFDIEFTTSTVPFTKAVTVNGNPATFTSVSPNGRDFVFTYTLQSGDVDSTPGVISRDVLVTLTDVLGNGASAPFSTTIPIDNLSPVISVPTVDDTIAGSGQTIAITATVADTGSISTPPTMLVLPNNAGTGNAATFVSRTGSAFTYAYKVKATDAEGMASVRLTANDDADNPATLSSTGIFRIDLSPPVLGSPGIDKTSQRLGQSVTVTVTVLDCSLVSGSPTIKFTNTSNGTVLETKAMTLSTGTVACSTAGTFTASHTVAAAETNGGSVTAAISAIDGADNSTAASVSYLVDNSAPVLSASSAFSPATNRTGSTTFTLVSSKPLAAATVLKVTPDNGTTNLGNGDTYSSGGAIGITPTSSFPCTSCTFTITGLVTTGNASTTWKAVATMVDTVGSPNSVTSTSTATFVGDKTLPAISGTPTVTPAILKAAQNVTISGFATKALSGVTIYTDNGDVPSANPQSCPFDTSTNRFTCIVTVSDATPTRTATASVTLTDSLGNVSAALTAGTYTLDNLLPALSGAPAPGFNFFKSGATVSVSVVAQDCNLTGATPVTATVSYVSKTTSNPVSSAMTLGTPSGSAGCATGKTFPFTRAVASDEPDGQSSVTFQATDAAGNVANLVTSYIVDNTQPVIPASSAFNPTTSFTGTAQLTFIASEPLQTVTLHLVNTTNGNTEYANGDTQTGGVTNPIGIVLDAGTPLPCTTCTFNLSNLKRGTNQDTWKFRVTAGTDRAGNTVSGLPELSTSTLTVDASSSGLTLTPTVTPLFVKTGVPITATGSATRPLSVISIDPITMQAGGASGDTGACSFNSAAVTCVVTSGATEGLRALLTGKMTDSAGTLVNQVWTAGSAYTVDNTAPLIALAATPVTGGVSVGGLMSFTTGNVVTVSVPVTDCDTGTTVSVTAMDAAGGAQAFVSSGSSGSIGCASAKTFTFTHTIGAGDAEGTSSISIIATDRAGNTSTPASARYGVDKTGPDTIGATSFSAARGKSGGVTFTFALTEPTQITNGTGTAADTFVLVDAGSTTYRSGFASNGITPTYTFASGATPCNPCSITVTNLTKATTSLTFTPTLVLKDALGNTRTKILTGTTYTNDTVLPAFSAVGVNAPTPAAGQTVTWTGTVTKIPASAGVTAVGQVSGNVDPITCSVAAPTGNAFPVTCTITVVTTAVGPTVRTVTVTATDDVGNIGTNATATFSVTNTAPAITGWVQKTTGVTTINVTQNNALTLVGTFAGGTGVITTNNPADTSPQSASSGADFPIAAAKLNSAPNTWTYTLNVTNSAGAVATSAVVINVLPTPTCAGMSPATVSLTSGSSTAITPTFTNGTGSIVCTGTNCGVNGPVSSGVALSVSPTTGTAVYTLTVTNAANASVTCSAETATVTVVPMPTMTGQLFAVTYTGSGSNLITAGSSLGSYTFKIPTLANGSTATIVDGAGNPFSNSGAITTASGGTTPAVLINPTPVGSVGTVTFTLTYQNSLNVSVSEQATLSVIAAPSATVFTVSPAAFTTDGVPVTFNATYSGASAMVSGGNGFVSQPIATTVPLAALAPAGVNTTFTLTVKNAAGDLAGTLAYGTTRAITSVPAPSALTLSSTPASGIVTTGSTFTLLPGFTNTAGGAAAAVINPGNIAVTNGVATGAITALAGTTVYTLTVTNPAGAVVTTTISITGVAAASCTGFGSATATLTSGYSTTITPTFSGGTGSISCTGAGCGSTITVSSGVGITVSPPTNATYTLAVQNAANTVATCSTPTVSITVVAAPSGLSLTSTPVSGIVTTGSTFTLTPVFTNTSGGSSAAVINPGAIAVTTGAPTGAITALAGTTVYTLSVTNSGGTVVTAQIWITGFAAPIPTAFTVSSATTTDGNPVTFNATYTGASGVLSGNNGFASQAISSGVALAVVVPAGASTTFTLTVKNAAGDAAGTVAFGTTRAVTSTAAAWAAHNVSVTTVRLGGTVTALPNGKVLMTGGEPTVGGTPQNTATICDPLGTCAAPAGSLGTCSGTTMQDNRSFHQAVLLTSGAHSGQVLIVGGCKTSACGTTTKKVDFYDPSQDCFVSSTVDTGVARSSFTATLLSDGAKVLLAGGVGLSSAEVYDSTVALPTATATSGMAQQRSGHTGTLLGNGKVLIVGGKVGNLQPELFDGSSTFSNSSGALLAGEDKINHTAVLIGGSGPNAGRVLISGGTTTAGVVATQFLSDAAGNTFTSVAPLGTARANHVAIGQTNTKVLLCGGGSLSSCELYDPSSGATGSVSGTATMILARKNFGMALLSIFGVPHVVASGGSTTTTTFSEVYATE